MVALPGNPAALAWVALRFILVIVWHRAALVATNNFLSADPFLKARLVCMPGITGL